ncbi:MAG TPA: ABC transporter substrate-binding protein [Acidimicrobiales bacterium]
MSGRLSERPGSRRSQQIRRYGPLTLIVVLQLVVAAIVLVGGDGGDTSAGDDAGGDGGASGSVWTDVSGPPGAPEPTGSMPVTYAEAEEAGTVDQYDWPDTCDTDRGTLAVPSVYALPCVPESSGDNGGATARGVTEDEIRILLYAPETPADLASLLGAMDVEDTPEQRLATFQQYVELFSSMAELYGRRIVIERFPATATVGDVVAARADATDVIARDPFLVVGGPAQDRGTFAQELAAAGIPCYACAPYLPGDMVEDMAPYVWEMSASIDQVLDTLDAWVAAAGEGGRMVSHAEFAGGDLRGQPRRIGVVHLDQDPPLYAETGAERAEEANVELTETYLLDLAAAPAKATEIIARFKSEGINTIVFLGDPFMPIYLTQAATEQDYHPEWIFTGVTLTDTNTLARQYDPAQMEHAYGISNLAAPTEQAIQEPIRLYRWYYGADAMPPAASQYALLWPPAAWLVSGIHMAGPELTPETFARGLFRIPPTGGGPTTPQISYGHWGFFDRMDYAGIDDAVEIWWDPTVRAEDERGQVGLGAWRRSDGGRRFTPDDPPPPRPFAGAEAAATVLDELPPEDRAPDYPPPPGSPAAGGG